ncbi:MAG: restriction endonuclease subunit S [Sphingomonadaceae bacterium]|nr:restriction endonuclease subunit S [Sphingomonadaceae bacterium]
MIPTGWDAATLEDLAADVTSGSRGWAKFYAENGNPFIRITNLTRESINLDLRKLKFVRVPEDSHEGTRTKLAQGDILMSITADLGTVGFVATEPKLASYISQHVARIRLPRGICHPRFVAHQLASERHWKVIQRLNDAGAKAGLNLPTIRSIPVWLPPLREQRHIAAVLDAWDEAIVAAKKLVAAKEQRLAWIRANVLAGDVRLRGFAKTWQTGPLSRILIEHGETSTGREEVHSVSVHLGLVNQIEHLGRSFAAASTDHYNRVLPGDIVYTKSPTGDFPLGIIKQSRLTKAAIVSPLYGVFTPASRELGAFLDTLFASPAAAERLLAPVVQKGAKNTIAVTNKNFLKARLHLPTDPREIVALSELVEAARAELDLHQAELKLLRNQKRGLMQKLLTGQWRVSESIDALSPGAVPA